MVQVDIKRLLLRIDDADLEADDGYKSILLALQGAGYETMGKKKLGHEMRAYFKLMMNSKETFYAFLLREANQFENVVAAGLTLQDEVRGLHVIEWIRITEETRSVLRMHVGNDVKISKLKPKMYQMFTAEQTGTGGSHGKAYFGDEDEEAEDEEDNDEEECDCHLLRHLKPSVLFYL